MNASTNHRPLMTITANPAGSYDHVPIHVARRQASLERSSTRIVERARQAGVTISYLGEAPLFAQPQAYAGPNADWVVYPVTSLSEAVIPRQQQEALLRLDDAGIDFRLVYVAHEVRQGQLALPAENSESSQPAPVTIDKATAARAIGPVPLHPDTVAVAERLGRSSQRLIRVLSKALPVAGLIVATPFVLAGATIGALAAGLDPVVFGVIPAGPPVEGQPATWYALARWDWPALPRRAGGG